MTMTSDVDGVDGVDGGHRVADGGRADAGDRPDAGRPDAGNGSDAGDRPDAVGARCRIDVDADGTYGWRVVAQNGRVVAVSARPFQEYDNCRSSFEALCRGRAQLAGAVQHTPGGNGWMWLLRNAEGGVVAVSARPYERHSTCRAAGQRFRALLAEMVEVTGSCP
ncbi:hypothetical protein ACFUN8_08955 [Streptomyces sp. NPDC057307]|uniref:hypothetical protein n=1 Tax=Streptomyces sp. NPDC057307 TaxID=3346096 RepID=UPI00363B8F55